MKIDICTIYCVCDDIIKALGLRSDQQCKMNDSEVVTVALVGALLFGANYTKARWYLRAHGFIPSMLSPSRLNRRLHRLPDYLWQAIMTVVARASRQHNPDNIYIVDSFPVPACHPCRSRVCRLFTGKKYLGYCASKKLNYFGLKVHVLVGFDGSIEELAITPASYSDIRGLSLLELNLPEGATIHGDKAYTSYGLEDLLRESCQICIVPQRRRNLKRQNSKYVDYIVAQRRKRVETVISQITRLMPRSVAARTGKGLILKLLLFTVAYSLERSIKL